MNDHNATEQFHVEFNRILDLIEDSNNLSHRYALLLAANDLSKAHYDALTEKSCITHKETNALQSQINTVNNDHVKMLTRIVIFQSILIILLVIITVLT